MDRRISLDLLRLRSASHYELLDVRRLLAHGTATQLCPPDDLAFLLAHVLSEGGVGDDVNDQELFRTTLERVTAYDLAMCIVNRGGEPYDVARILSALMDVHESVNCMRLQNDVDESPQLLAALLRLDGATERSTRARQRAAVSVLEALRRIRRSSAA